jgi:MIP family channel proteins
VIPSLFALLVLGAVPCSGCKEECLSEMLGTYVLVFIGPASVVIASFIPYLSSIESLTFIALVFGSTVASIIMILGRHSGAHINPAITVASTFAGIARRELMVPYIAFQVFGGLLAGLSLKIVFGTLAPSVYLGSTKIAAGITPIEGIVLETVGTFILAISALSASSFTRHPAKQAALVGATLFGLIMFIGPLTGASFNPSRSGGPALFSAYYANQLVYWIGPFLGGGLAGLIFGLVRKSYGRTRRLSVGCVC